MNGPQQRVEEDEELRKWLPVFCGRLGRDKSATARATLYCLSWAGGSPADFSAWDAEHASAALKVRPVCLPGRAQRIREPPITSVAEAAERVAAVVGRHAAAERRPFALYGQSYGALLAYEVARRICAAHKDAAPLLVAVVVASRPPPCVQDPPVGAARLSDIADNAELVRAVAAKYGDEQLARVCAAGADVLDVFVPQLRADLTAYENYRAVKAGEAGTRLPCPVLVCRGREDSTVGSEESLRAWARDFGSSGSKEDVLVFPGGHFFARDRAVAHELVACVERFVLECAENQKECAAETETGTTGTATGTTLAAPSEEEELLMCF